MIYFILVSTASEFAVLEIIDRITLDLDKVYLDLSKGRRMSPLRRDRTDGN